RGVPRDLRKLLQLVVTCEGSQVQRSVLDPNTGERQPIDVHHQAGPGEPVVEERHEALSSGQNLGLGAVLVEQRQGFVQRLRCRVLERMHASAFSRPAPRGALGGLSRGEHLLEDVQYGRECGWREPAKWPPQSRRVDRPNLVKSDEPCTASKAVRDA